MFHVTTVNGARPVPVGPEIQGVPEEIRRLITDLADAEVPMNETAAEKLMAAIGKNHEALLARIDAVKEQYYGMDKRVSVHETEVNKIAGLDLRMDGLDTRLTEHARIIDTRLTDIARDVGALKKASEEAANEQKADRRTVKDSAIRYGVALFLGGLLFAGGVWLRATVAPVPQNPPQASQDAQGAITSKIEDLIEEIRTDRAARESGPSQTIKVPQRTNKPRRAQPGPLIQQYRNGDYLVTSDPKLPTFGYNRIPIPPMEFPE